MPLISILAIIASQTRLLQIIEKIYGDSAFSNPVFAEYKRALETIEREAKDNLVIYREYHTMVIYLYFIRILLIKRQWLNH